MNNMDFFALVAAFILTFFCIWLLQPLAIRIGLVDAPTGRKQHKGRVPLIGGIAIFIGFLFALLTLPISLIEYRSLIASCVLLVLIGVLDDFHELPPKSRFVAQVLAGLFMTAWGGNSLQNVGNLFFSHEILLHCWSLPVTVIAVVGVINATNMLDGVDGVAGSLGIIEFSFLLFLAFKTRHFADAQLISLMMAALLAFLCFNFRIPGRKQALVFMGDAGSMLLGFVLVWFLVSLSQNATYPISPVIMLWIMIVPLFDIGHVMLHRLVQRRSLFSPDREHLHHLIINRGFGVLQTTLLLCLFSLLGGLIGIAGFYFQIADGWMFGSFVILFLIYYSVVYRLRKLITK